MCKFEKEICVAENLAAGLLGDSDVLRSMYAIAEKLRTVAQRTVDDSKLSIRAVQILIPDP
jgi:hypothetical protein